MDRYDADGVSEERIKNRISIKAIDPAVSIRGPIKLKLYGV
jgi:hypothetical protein